MDEATVRARLNEVLDPCSVVAGAPAGIEEMGLVRAYAERLATVRAARREARTAAGQSAGERAQAAESVSYVRRVITAISVP